MARLPRVTALEISQVLLKAGFSFVRQKGAHQVYRKAGTRVVVPYHAGKIIGPKLLKRILKQAGWTAEEFTRLLKHS